MINSLRSAATSPEAVICFDEQRLISICNSAASAMFGRKASQMTGQSIDTLIAAEDRALAHSGIDRVLGAVISGARESD